MRVGNTRCFGRSYQGLIGISYSAAQRTWAMHPGSCLWHSVIKNSNPNIKVRRSLYRQNMKGGPVTNLPPLPSFQTGERRFQNGHQSQESTEDMEWIESTSRRPLDDSHLLPRHGLQVQPLTMRPEEGNSTDGAAVLSWLRNGTSSYSDKVYNDPPRPSSLSRLQQCNEAAGPSVCLSTVPSTGTLAECQSILNLLKSKLYTDAVYGTLNVHEQNETHSLLTDTEALLDQGTASENQLASALSRLQALYRHLSL